MKRRQFLTSLPAVGSLLIALPCSAEVAAFSGELQPDMPRDRPFLHVMDHEVFLPSRGSLVRRGTYMAITPGYGPWDDLHLLRDGTLAAAAVHFHGDNVHIHQIETGDRWHVPKSRANEVIAGRVLKIIRQDRGRWVD